MKKESSRQCNLHFPLIFIREKIEAQKRAWEAKNPASIIINKPKPEFYVEQPLYTSLKQKREVEKIEARKRIGLSEKHIDIKDSSNDPTTRYVSDPQIISKKQLVEKRKDETLKELKMHEANIGNFKDMNARLEERETCRIRLANTKVSEKTKEGIKEERR